MPLEKDDAEGDGQIQTARSAARRDGDGRVARGDDGMRQATTFRAENEHIGTRESVTIEWRRGRIGDGRDDLSRVSSEKSSWIIHALPANFLEGPCRNGAKLAPARLAVTFANESMRIEDVAFAMTEGFERPREQAHVVKIFGRVEKDRRHSTPAARRLGANRTARNPTRAHKVSVVWMISGTYEKRMTRRTVSLGSEHAPRWQGSASAWRAGAADMDRGWVLGRSARSARAVSVATTLNNTGVMHKSTFATVTPSDSRTGGSLGSDRAEG